MFMQLAYTVFKKPELRDFLAVYTVIAEQSKC
jgi:hypothetical protein